MGYLVLLLLVVCGLICAWWLSFRAESYQDNVRQKAVLSGVLMFLLFLLLLLALTAPAVGVPA